MGAAVNGTNPKIVEPAGIAKALTEAGPNDASVNVATPPSSTAAPAENKTTKNRRVARHVEPRVAARRLWRLGLGRERVSLVLTASTPDALEYALGSAGTWLPYIMGGSAIGRRGRT